MFALWSGFGSARNADPKSHQPIEPVKIQVPRDLCDAVDPECDRDWHGQQYEQ
jgi:hypothetical protein